MFKKLWKTLRTTWVVVVLLFLVGFLSPLARGAGALNLPGSTLDGLLNILGDSFILGVIFAILSLVFSKAKPELSDKLNKIGRSFFAWMATSIALAGLLFVAISLLPGLQATQ